MTVAPLRAVIDTDPGLDDAIALLFALTDPAFRIELVTSVAGNIGLATTTRNVGRLLAVAGSRIPYAAGAAAPLARPGIDEAAIHGADGLGGVALPDPIQGPIETSAAEALAALLEREPAGTLAVLALGPLTNLALLARDRPAAFRRIERIVAMGGTIREPGNWGPHAEFNIASDPEAAALVFSGGVPLTLVPLDVTRRMRATPGDLAALAGAPSAAARIAAALIGAYFAGNEGRQSRPLHDPCVMLLAAAPGLFEIQTLRLAVDCDAEPGRLRHDPDGATVSVAMSVDSPAALARLWQGLGT